MSLAWCKIKKVLYTIFFFTLGILRVIYKRTKLGGYKLNQITCCFQLREDNRNSRRKKKTSAGRIEEKVRVRNKTGPYWWEAISLSTSSTLLCMREENWLKKKKKAPFIRKQLPRNQVPRALFRNQICPGDEVGYQDRYIWKLEQVILFPLLRKYRIPRRGKFFREKAYSSTGFHKVLTLKIIGTVLKIILIKNNTEMCWF